MSIHKDERQPGKWVVSLRERDWTGQVKQHKKRGFSTQREAKAYERERLSNVSDCNSLTLRGLYEIYIKDCEIRLKAATVVSIKQIFQHHILPAMGEKALDDITPLILRNWLLSLKEQGFTYSTINTQRCRLSAFFGYAVRYYGLRSNPLSVVTGVLQREKTEHKIYTVDQFKQFMEACAPKCALAFKVLFYTGLRKGELLGLQYGDLKGNILHVGRQRTAHGISTPKTPSSVRSVSIPESLVDGILDRKRRTYGSTDRDFIFPFHVQTLDNASQRAAAKAGLECIGVHGFRHSHASILISKGLPVTIISKRLGHSSPAMTLNVYAHAIKKDNDKVIDVLNSL